MSKLEGGFQLASSAQSYLLGRATEQAIAWPKLVQLGSKLEDQIGSLFFVKFGYMGKNNKHFANGQKTSLFIEQASCCLNCA